MDDTENMSLPEKLLEYGKRVLWYVFVNILVLAAFTCIALDYCILKTHPAANFVLLFLAMTLLAYVEALHYACVAVERWDMTQFKERFPRAVKCQELVNTPEKVKKFIVGRQFFVIFVVFLIAEITTFPYIPKDFMGLPPTLVLVLLQTGLPGMFLVLTYGQLISQIFVEEYTLQFLNYYGCEFCIRLSLGAEWVGICHFSWFLFEAMSRLWCGNVRRAAKIIKSRSSEQLMLEEEQRRKSQEDLKKSSSEKALVASEDIGTQPVHWAEPQAITLKQKKVADEEAKRQKSPLEYVQLYWFDALRYVWSTFATLGSVGIILYGISIKGYVLPVDVPGAYIIAIIMLSILWYLEGLMIALVGVQYWDPETFKHSHPRAYQIHKLANKPNNMKRFIIGRQFFTVLTNFLLAQIFVFAKFQNPGWDPAAFYIIIKSGLVGVLTILAFAQLMPELLAAEYPLRFMNLPLSYTIVYISLVFDWIGIGHCAWTTYYITRRFCCAAQMEEAEHKGETARPELLAVESPEILAHEIDASMPKRSSSFSFGGYGGVKTNEPRA